MSTRHTIEYCIKKNLPAWAPTARADAELSAQLNRRLDINEGAARPRRCKVFHPYSEFPEFSRRLIKDLESMFKL